MHTTSIHSRSQVPSEKSNYWASWAPQFCKSMLLTASSLGLGWLMNRLWKGSAVQDISSNLNPHALISQPHQHQPPLPWSLSLPTSAKEIF